MLQKMYLALQLNRIVISTKGEICWAVVQGLSRSLVPPALCGTSRNDKKIEQLNITSTAL